MTNNVTVCLTFDFDAESVQIRQLEEPGRVSKGRFAVRRGIPRILSLLKQYEIQVTFFTCGWVAETYPDLTQQIVAEGHEVAAHGYLHEYFDTLSIEEEKNVLERTEQALTTCTGQPIRGFRAPFWRMSPNTLHLIAEREYLYDSSLFDDDRPYIFQPSESFQKLVEFPVEWFMDDWVLFEEKQLSPTQVYDIWRSQFDAYATLKDIPAKSRVLTLTCHPACIGHAYRIKVLEKIIQYMEESGVQFERMDRVAETLQE